MLPRVPRLGFGISLAATTAMLCVGGIPRIYSPLIPVFFVQSRLIPPVIPPFGLRSRWPSTSPSPPLPSVATLCVPRRAAPCQRALSNEET